jgi:nucleotide-binding universal stress UspA family protein
MPFRNLLVGVDGSPASLRALAAAVDLAAATGDALRIVAVAEPSPMLEASIGDDTEELRAAGEERLRPVIDQALDGAARAGVRATATLALGYAAPILVDKATAVGGDLIVVGHAATRTCWAGCSARRAPRSAAGRRARS